MVDARDHLRAQMQAKRRMLRPQLRARWSARIRELLVAVLGGFPGHTIGVYWPLPTEPDTIPLIARWQRNRTRLALPVAEDGQWRWRRLLRLPDPATDPRSDLSACTGRASVPDVAIVPGLAFDPRGYRLGHGGGIYDRLLTAVPVAIGVAFPFQFVHHIPEHSHDVPVDLVVLPSGVHGTTQSSAAQQGAQHESRIDDPDCHRRRPVAGRPGWLSARSAHGGRFGP
ncbi:MAG: 5-formyltetrahydrofolate cyclo-ligase [Candidatus Dadabacteria bacterium]|nr:MAG: 5-formyltetrahydrofolate cyclo-ligase [Candidatus Dadabacteria bacterium]